MMFVPHWSVEQKEHRQEDRIKETSATMLIPESGNSLNETTQN